MAKKNSFNEATRVQMPALVHLLRLGYQYYGKLNEDMAGKEYDPDTNILIKVFLSQFEKLNPSRKGEALSILHEIRQELDNDDLGRAFYNRLTSVSPIRLIDFETPEIDTENYEELQISSAKYVYTYALNSASVNFKEINFYTDKLEDGSIVINKVVINSDCEKQEIIKALGELAKAREVEIINE